MKVLLVTDFPEYFIKTIERYGDEVVLINDIEITHDYVISNNIKIILFCGYNYHVSSDILASAICVGVHFSMLPFGRGPTPLLASWVNNEPIGVTMYEMTEKLDSGPIIIQQICPMDAEHETLGSSVNKLFDLTSVLFDQYWGEIRLGSYQRKMQLGIGSSHSDPADSIIDLAIEMSG